MLIEVKSRLSREQSHQVNTIAKSPSDAPRVHFNDWALEAFNLTVLWRFRILCPARRSEPLSFGLAMPGLLFAF